MPPTIRSEDSRRWNREAWDRQVASGNRWTIPVGSQAIEAARRGDWSVVLTGLTPVPRNWFPEDMRNAEILCLASGGGQQAPILAAAGARVTVLDNSPAQLERDRAVSDEHGLGIETVLGDMADLSRLSPKGAPEGAEERFDLIFHPVSNVFAEAVRPVWRECFRVLRRGGELLAGFMNPAIYVFDWPRFEETGERIVRFRLPYADVRDRSEEELAEMRESGAPVEFSHTLQDQIGGQLDAGLQLVGLYENARAEIEEHGPSDPYLPAYIATRARKPS